MGLAEGQPDRQLSADSVWRLFLDSVFAIHRRSVLEQRANPIDRNRYEVHVIHFEAEQNSEHSSHGNKHCGRRVRTANTDAKSTFHMYYKDR